MLGRKDSLTRFRIIVATEKLLADSRGLEPSVGELASAAGIYFSDVEEAVLAVVEQRSG